MIANFSFRELIEKIVFRENLILPKTEREKRFFLKFRVRRTSNEIGVP